MIYLDYASATPLDPDVRTVMDRCYTQLYGNPSSMHALGLEVRHALDDARQTVANVLHCKPMEILFTSGGTESNNLVLQGVVRALKQKGRHIITTKIEHSSVLKTCEHLQRDEECDVTHLRVDANGLVNVDDVEKAIKKDTILISIGYANNEIGVIQDVAKIGEIARKHDVLFHTDACQAASFLSLDVQKLHVDFMTLNGIKLYGPKGVGVLYKRTGAPLKPILYGGGQEFGFRSGTENVPAIVGFAKALELVEQRKEEETKRLTALRDYLIKGLRQKIPDIVVHGDIQQRLPNNVNFTVRGLEGESLMLLLSDRGFLTSIGSACASKSSEPSHVLTAIGLSYRDTRASLRVTLGRETTKENVEQLLRVLPEVIAKIRRRK